MAVKFTLFLLAFVLLVTTMASSVEDIDDIESEGPPTKDSLRAQMLEARIYASKKRPTRGPAKAPAPSPIRAPIKLRFPIRPLPKFDIPGLFDWIIGQQSDTSN
ncbi:hypothetical protein BUALT_Bualt16G0011600 [Buddleja alternifolia]|uniref:Uncharacterized protein n=1 Tax=Buddleja alternifolia TaxID=168488 RepID=A0AAV6WHF7_9LAMI|nr:hypothetical protein BUALT_Bualt16G0011600 [Buddleja alternifolia]